VNVALYYSRTAQTRRQRNAAEAAGRLEESAPQKQILTEAGSFWHRGTPTVSNPVAPVSNQTTGFWMIPTGKEYLKLKILKEYSTGPGYTTSQPWPVGPLLQNRKLLQAHMPWLKRLLGQSSDDRPDLWDPGADGYEEAAAELVHNLFYRKWRYFVLKGTTGYFGSNKSDGSDPMLRTLLREIFGGAGQRPANVKVDAAGMTRLQIVNADGQMVKAFTREQLDALLASATDDEPKEPEGGEDLQAKMRQYLDTDEPWRSLYLLVKHVADLKVLSTINSELLEKVLSPKFVARNLSFVTDALKDSPRREIERLRGIIVGFLKLAEDDGDDLPFTLADYPPELKLPRTLSDSVTEASYYDLWDVTRRNGDYQYGGMRRIRGRWVYDPSVRGRSTNGARFVTVAPPKPFLDDDGRISLRFRYQSRPARNTTGMSQVGYIKFVDHAGFMRTASRNIGKAIAKRDVEVLCSCPDFKYRWHWVLAQAGAAPAPVGAGNSPPDKTNPKHLESMCKHLSAVSQFLLTRPTAAYDKEVRRVIKQSRQAGLKPKEEPGTPDASPAVKPGAEITTSPVAGGPPTTGTPEES